MRITLIILLTLITCLQTYSQAKYPSGPVYFEIDNENDDLKGIFEWTGGGMILVTGENAFINDESSIHNKRLHFFTEKLGHVWSKPIDHAFATGKEDWRIVSTDRFIYHITTPNIPGKTLESYVSQFTRYGEKKTFKVELNEVDRSWFFDDDNLYLLKSGKKEEFYNLVEINHSTLKQNEYILELPAMKTDGNQFNSERWTFFGYSNETLLFYNKIVNNTPPEQKVEYEILLINKSNDIISTYTIDAGLDKKNAIMPTNNRHFAQTVPIKGYKKNLTSKAEPNLAAYSDIYFDQKAQSIIIFGQYGEKICSNGNCKYAGIFIQNYNLEGEELWKTSKPFPEKFLKRDPYLSKSDAASFTSRLCHLIHDKWNEHYQVVCMSGDSKKKRAYLSKFSYNGDYLITTRADSKERPYFRDATNVEDRHNKYRYYEYDSYYMSGLPENSKGEDRFQDLINLTPGLNIALYELYSFESGEVIVEKLNQRKAIVFYFVVRN